MEQTGADHKTESSSPDFRTVPPEQIAAVWPQIHPYVERGLRHGQGDSTSPELMRAHLLLGNHRLWVAMDGEDVMGGVIWCQRQTDVGNKICVEMIFGRDMELWLDELMVLGKDMQELTGAQAIEGSCRPGLARVLKRYGWRVKATIMEF